MERHFSSVFDFVKCEIKDLNGYGEKGTQASGKIKEKCNGQDYSEHWPLYCKCYHMTDSWFDI